MYLEIYYPTQMTATVIGYIRSDNVSAVKRWVESHPRNLDSQDKLGRTALHYATVNVSEKVVNYLLEAGANVNMADKNGFDPLCAMLELTPNPEEEEKELRIVSKLIEHGAGVNDTARFGSTPLYYAARNGSVRMVDLLVRSGANIHARTQTGTTPFLSAVRNGKHETMEQLKMLGANIHTRTANWDNAIHMAVGKPATVQLLISWGVNPDLCNMPGRTPLFVACEEGCVETVKVLLNNGVDTKHEVLMETINYGLEKLTALKFCRFRGLDDIAKVIEDYENIPDIKEPVED